MTQHRVLTRREFSLESLTALFAGVVITVSACNDDGAPGGPSSGDRAGNVGTNHGHVATVTAMQLAAGNSVVLDIRGTADHPHTVQLSADEVLQIADGIRVSKVSSTESSPSTAPHVHTVTFN